MVVRNSQNIKFTLTTQAIEGITPSTAAIRLCEKLSDGKVNADTAVETIKGKYGLTRPTRRNL